MGGGEAIVAVGCVDASVAGGGKDFGVWALLAGEGCWCWVGVWCAEGRRGCVLRAEGFGAEAGFFHAADLFGCDGCCGLCGRLGWR